MVQYFDKFYNNQLNNIVKAIDYQNLKLSPDAFNFKYKKIEDEDKLSLVQLKVKWNHINDAEKYENNGFKNADNGCIIAECIETNHISFIMNIYVNQFVSRYIHPNGNIKNNEMKMEFVDVFFNLFGDEYTTTHLIDDFHHISKFHLKNDENIKIYSNCINDNKDNFCCHNFLQRRNLDRETINTTTPITSSSSSSSSSSPSSSSVYSKFDKYIRGLTPTEVNLLQICSRIHTRLNHTEQQQKPAGGEEEEQEEEREGEEEKAAEEVVKKRNKIRSLISRDSREGMDTKYNKFVNEVEIKKEEKQEKEEEEEEEEGKCGLSDGIIEILSKNGYSLDKAKLLFDTLKNEGYDTDSIIFDLTDDNDQNLSFINSFLFKKYIKNKYIIKQIKKIWNIKKNDSDYLPSFKFGSSLFRHWQHYQTDPRFIQRGKFSNLKDETLNNDIHSIDIDLWQEIMESAIIYSKSQRGKSITAKDWGLENTLYEIPVDLGLSSSHLLALMMYCNLTKLQYNYKRFCCRKMNDDDDEKQLINRHKEISCWYKLLVEAVEFFGDRVQSGEIYYTGINTRLVFNTFTPRFYAPISTTTTRTIAEEFSDGRGMIIKMKPVPGSWDQCFNVKWFSNFSREDEKLFVRISEMEIADIEYFIGSTAYKNGKYIGAFKFFSSIWDGHYIFVPKKMKKLRSNQKVLLDLIKNYKDHNMMVIKTDDDDMVNVEIPMYIQKMFWNILNNLKHQKIYVIKKEFLFMKKELRKEFILFEDDDDDEFEYKDNIDQDQELKLKDGTRIKYYQFFGSLNVKPSQIRIMKQYYFILNGPTFNQLRNGKPDQYIYSSDTFKYTLASGDAVDFKIGLCRRTGGSTSAGFRLKIVKTKRKIGGVFSIIIDEIGYTHNKRPFSNLKDGQRKGIYAFKDAAIDTLQSVTLRCAVLFD